MRYFVFQGRDILQRLKAIDICRSTHKSTIREAYMQELQVLLNQTLLATLVTHVGTPSSGSASDKTCVRIGLDFLKPYRPPDCYSVTENNTQEDTL